MKLNKSKNKGKVHPSPTCCSSNDNDPISSLNHLLPTAILTLISILSLQDREALAYMITHSLKSSNNLNYPKKKSNKRNYNNNYIPSNSSSHTSPSFDCCCFDCFSHFWNLWDSSPHSELIHQAIEAFEEHLSSTEIKKKNNKNNKSSHNSSSKRRENNNHNNNKMVCSTAAADVEERDSLSGSTLVPVQEVVGVVLDDVEERENEVEEECSPVAGDGEEEERESGTQKKMLQQQQHKGLARKVLPDFIGLFHSRLWNLWGPNV